MIGVPILIKTAGSADATSAADAKHLERACISNTRTVRQVVAFKASGSIDSRENGAIGRATARAWD